MKHYRTTADLCLIVAAIVILAGLLFFWQAGHVGAMGVQEPHVFVLQVKGDCFADRVVGDDLYTTPDEYCMTGRAATMPADDTQDTQDERKEDKRTVEPPVVEPPVVEAPVPTVEPPVVEPPAAADDESSCKNKNSGKDNTPKECNAGGGQEKQHNK